MLQSFSGPAIEPAEPQQPELGLDPLFRWPGGKRWLVPDLLRLVPSTFGVYFEPFVGAGALFFALGPPAAVISDRNEELMTCYRAIRDDPLAVTTALGLMPRDRETYYQVRGEVPRADAERAARFIYLASLAFNGIYRVNRSGEFNVPYSGRTRIANTAVEDLARYSEVLRHADLRSGDFEETLAAARPGALVYIDPPYTVAHANNGFLKYNDRIFSWADQQRLASIAAELARDGCSVIVSNAYHESILRLYRGFRAIPVERWSVIAAARSRRIPIREYVFTNVG